MKRGQLEAQSDVIRISALVIIELWLEKKNILKELRRTHPATKTRIKSCKNYIAHLSEEWTAQYSHRGLFAPACGIETEIYMINEGKWPIHNGWCPFVRKTVPLLKGFSDVVQVRNVAPGIMNR